MKISQIPELPRARMALTAPSQPLKSPITCTDRAFGAQTANDTPSMSPSTDE